MNIKKILMEEFREKFVKHKLFAQESFGYELTEVQDFLSQALTRIEEAAREEMVKEFGIVLDKINQGLREESPYKREILFKDAKDIMSSLSPSEEKESDCGCCELKHNLPPVNERGWMRVCDMCFTTNCHSPKKEKRGR